MDSQTHLCVFIVLSLFGQSLSLTPKLHVCDMSRADNLQEGNIGESENFPWLGILRVNLHEFDQVKVAVTGLVLVKERYAIANAQDIAKIPKPVFIEDSNAMFIPKRGEPWVTKLKDYMIHHEFQFFTYNTIALVELELEERTIMPFKPVCWPGNYFNTTNLYALGYTDDNKRMEKTIYSLQYVKPSLCKDFYNSAGFSETKSAPTYIQCGVATNNKKDCLWENGMAMVSNSSGKWTLIGFGVRGPGCSAPARFIDMFAFLPWVERATDLEQTNDLPDYQRKTAFNVGFRRKYTDSNNRLEVKRTKVEVETATRRFSMPYHNAGSGNYTIYRLEPGLTQWFEMPLHLEEAGFMSADRCWAHKILVYRDRMKLVENSINGGNLEYRVSLYDKNVHNYTCFTLKMRNVVSPQPVMIYFTYRIDRFEGTSFTGDTGETPSNLFKYFPMSSISEPEEKVKDKKGEEPFWKPGKHLEPKYLVDDANHSGRENINVIIAFTFKGTATVEIQIFGYPEPKSEDTTTEISTTTDHRRMEPPPKLVPKPVKSRGFSILRDQSKSRKPRTPTPLGSNAINSNSLFNIPKMFHQKKRRELPSTSKPKLKSSPKTSNIPNGVQKELPLKTHRRKRKNRKARTPPPKLRSSSIEKVSFENMLKKRKSRLEKARERELQRRLLAFG